MKGPLSRSTQSVWITGCAGWCVLVLLAVSCANYNGDDTGDGTVTTCVLPSDQGGTIRGRWIQTAVPIAFQQGAWNPNEIAMIQNAVTTWNQFFATSMGYPAIDMGSTTSPTYSSQPVPTDESTFCSDDTVVNSDFSLNGSPVVIYKDTVWPAAYPTDAIALTTPCETSAPGHSIPAFTNAYIEVNYQSFFVTSEVPDLQSIILHEFGHLMGLMHSCEYNSTESGMPDCSDPDLNPLYESAVMFPQFSFNTAGEGSVNRALQPNDEGRVNCIYQDL